VSPLSPTVAVGISVGWSFSTNTYGGMSSEAGMPKNSSKPTVIGPGRNGRE